MADYEIDLAAGSGEQLLACLNLALDEAKESRLTIKSTDDTDYTLPKEFYADQLSFLDREIEYLEAMQQRVKSKLERGSSVSG